MDRIKRNERLAAMARVLTGTPNRLYTLSHFTAVSYTHLTLPTTPGV